jgi:hypothetical protein
MSASAIPAPKATSTWQPLSIDLFSQLCACKRVVTRKRQPENRRSKSHRHHECRSSRTSVSWPSSSVVLVARRDECGQRGPMAPREDAETGARPCTDWLAITTGPKATLAIATNFCMAVHRSPRLTAIPPAKIGEWLPRASVCSFSEPRAVMTPDPIGFIGMGPV